jgi:hypothetical protein
MQTRLLAFLADTEQAIRSERNEPRKACSWDNSRSVNYSAGVARMAFGARESSGETRPLGGLLLQSFELADATICLKATLSWQDSDLQFCIPIFAKPALDWDAEARRLAETWLSGPTPANAARPIAVSADDPALLAAG